jgi:hypothetical protein
MAPDNVLDDTTKAAMLELLARLVGEADISIDEV